MYTRLCRYCLHVPCLTYLLVRTIRSIDRSSSEYMIGEKKRKKRKKGRTRSTERKRESRYFFGQGISLHEITYISLEYLDGKTNKRESRRGNNDNTLHNKLTTGLLATHVAFPFSSRWTEDARKTRSQLRTFLLHLRPFLISHQAPKNFSRR